MDAIPSPLKIARRTQRLGDLCLLKGHFITQVLQRAQCPALGNFAGFLVNMRWPQLLIRLLLFEYMINDDQDAMSQSHKRLLVPHALAQSLVIGTQKGITARVQRRWQLQ
jgi:hypothetical protein